MGRDRCPRALDLRGVADVMTGELSRQRFDTGAVKPVVAWLVGLRGPVPAYYEAKPTGFGLYRAARGAGIDSQVIAPSKTLRPSGERNRSDQRDTDLLLGQLMADALTALAVPSATLEAARDLARARELERPPTRASRRAPRGGHSEFWPPARRGSAARSENPSRGCRRRPADRRTRPEPTLPIKRPDGGSFQGPVTSHDLR